MVSSSAGDMQTQSTSCVFVALLYMGGQLPGEMEEFTEWWTAQKAALQSADDSVCVRRWARYAKMHTQSTVVTLERALGPSGSYLYPDDEQHPRTVLR